MFDVHNQGAAGRGAVSRPQRPYRQQSRNPPPPNDPALRGIAKGEADGGGAAGGQLHAAMKIRDECDFVSKAGLGFDLRDSSFGARHSAAHFTFPSMELEHAELVVLRREGSTMWSRWICVAAICLGLAPNAEAGERSGLVHRASCTVVRFYVARYSASAAENWARSHGATEAEIEAARHCIKDTPTQTVQAAANWAAQ